MNSILEKDLLNIVNSNTIDWNEFNNTTIFITGATGLIGSIIVRAIQKRNELFNSNIKLLLLVRNKEKGINIYGDDKNIVYIESSIENFDINKLDIDYIIHAASPTKSKFFIENPVETIDTAVLGTRNVLRLANNSNVKSMIYLSSMEMYGTMDSDNVSETDLGYIDPLNVRSSYSEGKRMCELYCHSYFKEYGVPVKIGRISQTFGPGIDVHTENRVYKYFLDQIIKKEDIIVKSTGSTKINYVYPTDVVLGIFTVLLKGKVGEAYNIVGEKTGMTIFQSALWLSQKFGAEHTGVIIVPEKNAGFAPDNNMVLSNDKIKSLGWNPQVSLKEGYTNLLEYMKEEYAKDEAKVKKIGTK